MLAELTKKFICLLIHSWSSKLSMKLAWWSLANFPSVPGALEVAQIVFGTASVWAVALGRQSLEAACSSSPEVMSRSEWFAGLCIISWAPSPHIRIKNSERPLSWHGTRQKWATTTMVRWRTALAAHAVQPELSLLKPVSPVSLKETCCASTLGGRGRIPCVL